MAPCQHFEQPEKRPRRGEQRDAMSRRAAERSVPPITRPGWKKDQTGQDEHAAPENHAPAWRVSGWRSCLPSTSRAVSARPLPQAGAASATTLRRSCRTLIPAGDSGASRFRSCTRLLLPHPEEQVRIRRNVCGDTRPRRLQRPHCCQALPGDDLVPDRRIRYANDLDAPPSSHATIGL